MRILITGATGLIGSSLTARLLALSHHITVLTRDERRAGQAGRPAELLANAGRPAVAG